MLTRTEQQDRRLFFGLWRARHLAVALACGWLGVAVVLHCLSRKSLFTYVLFTLVALLALFLVDLVGLAGVVSYPALFAKKKSVGGTAVPNLDVWGEAFEDLASSWGYPSERIPYRYQTDRRGYRNATDRDEADVYMLGDSILVAGLLPFEETITGLLERELGSTTMNLALTGLSPQEERDIFLDAELPLENHLVLHFVFEGNDLLDSSSYRKRQHAGVDLPEASFFHRTLSYHLMMWLQRLSSPGPLRYQRSIGRISGRDYLFAWLERSFTGYEEEFPHVVGALDDVRSAVATAGGTYAVVFVPAKIRVLGPFCTWPEESSLSGYEKHLNWMRQKLDTWCASNGIAMLDLTEPLFESAMAGKVPWFGGDTHPNAVGHRVAADAIKQWDVVREWNARAKAEM